MMVLWRPIPVVFPFILEVWFARERLSPSMVNDDLNNTVEFLSDSKSLSFGECMSIAVERGHGAREIRQ